MPTHDNAPAAFSEADREACLRDALAYVLVPLARTDPSVSVGLIARAPITSLLELPFQATKYGLIDARGPKPWETFIPLRGVPDMTLGEIILSRLAYALRRSPANADEAQAQLDLLLQARGEHSIAQIFSRDTGAHGWWVDDLENPWDSDLSDEGDPPVVLTGPLDGGEMSISLSMEHYDEELEVEVWKVVALWSVRETGVFGRCRGYLVHSEDADQTIDGGVIYDAVTGHSDELGNLAYAFLRDRRQRGARDEYGAVFFLADWQTQPPTRSIDTRQDETFLKAVVAMLSDDAPITHIVFDATPDDYAKGIPLGLARAFGFCDDTGLVANKYLMQQRVCRAVASATLAEVSPIMPSYEQGLIPDLMRLADVCHTIPELTSMSLPVHKMAPPARPKSAH